MIPLEDEIFGMNSNTDFSKHDKEDTFALR